MLEHANKLLTKFAKVLWNVTIETVTAQLDESMVFRWRKGLHICIYVEAHKSQT